MPTEAPLLQQRLLRLPAALFICVATSQMTLPDAERAAGSQGLTLEDAVAQIAPEEAPALEPIPAEELDSLLDLLQCMDAGSVEQFATGKATWQQTLELAREHALTRIASSPRYQPTARAFRESQTPLKNIYTYMRVIEIATA